MTIWLSHTVRWEIWNIYDRVAWRVSTDRLKTSWYQIGIGWSSQPFLLFILNIGIPSIPKNHQKQWESSECPFRRNLPNAEARYVSRCRATACSACPETRPTTGGRRPERPERRRFFSTPLAVDPKNLHSKTLGPLTQIPNSKCLLLVDVFSYSLFFWIHLINFNNTIWNSTSLHAPEFLWKLTRSVFIQPTQPIPSQLRPESKLASEAFKRLTLWLNSNLPTEGINQD